MNLDFIKETACPICGCNVVISEEVEFDKKTQKYTQHCNGGKWERRTFACGQRLSYCPNFSKTEFDKASPCANDQQYQEKKQRTKALIEQLNSIVANSDVEEDIKQKLKIFYY